MRENTLGRVHHPDPLLVAGRAPLTRIDDPVAARCQKGDPTFGWEGDERLQLYLDQRAREWVLVRLEHDGVYRVTLTAPAGFHSAFDVVAEMVLALVRTDVRRGFDPHAEVVASHERVDRAREAAHRELVEETADRMASALRRDGV